MLNWPEVLVPVEKQVTCHPVTGSTLNSVYRLTGRNFSWFLKTTPAAGYSGQFSGEAAGLKAIEETHTLRVPRVIGLGTVPEPYLLMEWFDQVMPSGEFWDHFARGLAGLHRTTNPQFGYPVQTWCGNIPMDNRFSETWTDFYFHRRLEPEFRFCRDSGLFSPSDAGLFTQFSRWFLSEPRFPVEAPSLIHGDLWSGNFLCSAGQDPVLIDPAVYFGHREIDLGMALLFGGFPRKFFQSYHREWNLEDDWEFRIPLSQLYHLLLHVRLFDGSYRDQVLEVLRRYVQGR